MPYTHRPFKEGRPGSAGKLDWEAQYMSSDSNPSHFAEAHVLKCGNITHVAVAGGVRVYWVGFNDSRSLILCMRDGGLYQAFCKALAAELASEEKAGQRPDVFFTGVGAIETPVSITGSDGAPCYRLAFEIGQNAYRSTLKNCFAKGFFLL